MTPSAQLASALVLILAVVTLGYIFTCAVWPFRACRRCHGTGRIRAPLGRMLRLCRRCDGTGLRIRLGRHVWNELRRLHHDSRR